MLQFFCFRFFVKLTNALAIKYLAECFHSRTPPVNVGHFLPQSQSLYFHIALNKFESNLTTHKKRKGEIIKAELYIEEFLVEFDDWTNTRLLRPSILSLKKQVRDLIVNETLNNIEDYYNDQKNGEDLNSHLNKVYDKFSSNLVKKIKKASNNGKDEKAIEVINQIFLNEK